MAKIVTTGCAFSDILLKPVDKELFSVDSMRLKECKTNLGGDAMNASIDLHKLGVGDDLKLVAAVGNDVYGSFVLQEMKRLGLSTDGMLVKDECGTSICFVCIESCGERHFLPSGDANDFIFADEVIASFDDDTEAVHIGSLMVCDGLERENLVKLFKYSREHGIRTSFDVTADAENKWLEKLEDGLYYTDIMFVSECEAVSLTGGLTNPDEIAEFFKKYGIKEFVLKLGKLGCYVTDYKTTKFTMPTYGEIPVVDTTGAGDAYVSGYLFGKYKGLSMEECAQLGTINGSLAITAVGANASTATIDDLKKFIREHGTKNGIDGESLIAKL